MKKKIWIPITIIIVLFLFIAIASNKQETQSQEKTKEETIEQTTYSTYYEEDFTFEHPDWNEFEQEEEVPQRVLGVTQGVCSILVDKHNALPKDIIAWLENAIEENPESNLIRSWKENEIYYITYESPYLDYTVTSKIKIFYCNYMSYMVNVMCVNELITPEYEQISDETLDKSFCRIEYEIPTPEIIQEEKQEIIEEEPEVIEEIQESIVKTNIGDAYDLDLEVVVYFINGNQFFNNVLKDFPKGNIIVEDPEGDNIEVKVTIDSEGKIELVEDGQHSNPDVTLILPLQDILNILSNANNLTPANLIQFAINVRTIPEEIKNEVFEKILRGEYN